ncbi:MAG: GTPase domain-containing protein [Alphaproteobacteria bacterium]|nr:GTPase domain-containing protein [Alphaproteobacteria bacterium]
MATVNWRTRSLRLKIVYYGPGMCGKTTNLQALHGRFAGDQRGALVKLDTETERTLFFDYFPANVGRVGGLDVQVDLYTVPGQSFYNATRKAVLDKVDGIVFVADSARRRETANVVSLRNLKENLATYGRHLADVPHVFQWNKRDGADALPVETLQRALNPDGRPAFEAVASNGEGVWETQAAVIQDVLKALREEAKVARSHG